jgi:hypothetical protein
MNQANRTAPPDGVQASNGQPEEYRIRLASGRELAVFASAIDQSGGDLNVYNGDRLVLSVGSGSWLWFGRGTRFMASVERKKRTIRVKRGGRGEPQFDGVGGSPLLRDVMSFIRRYVVMTDSQLLVTALWVFHTHCVEFVDTTPYLAVTSPEKQCGKTRLIETMEQIVADPQLMILPSEAVVYRTVDAVQPTLLLDETDAIFNQRSERYEGLRALLNAGYRRGATVSRCVGATGKVEKFQTFCPKLIAGIGMLPETVADRSVPIRLERRKRNQPVARFFRRDVQPVAMAIRGRIEKWSVDHLTRLRGARPSLPDELSDRMQEGCECLVAIADLLGCGPAARQALVELLTAERVDDRGAMRTRLLRDLKSVWQQREAVAGGKQVRAIPTDDLLRALWQMEESPWGSYFGRVLEARDLADLLHHYGIRSTTIRPPGAGTKPVKGYRRDDLYEAWSRYAPDEPT